MARAGNGSRSQRTRSFKRRAAAGAATLGLAVASGCDTSGTDASNTSSTALKSDTTPSSAADGSASDTTDIVAGGDDEADGPATEPIGSVPPLTDGQRRLIAGFLDDDAPRSVEAVFETATADGDPYVSWSELRELDADGDSHSIVNAPSRAGAGDPDQKIESWSDGTWLYLEYTGYPQAGSGGAVDSWRAPVVPREWWQRGVFKVDLRRVGDELDLTPEMVEVAVALATLRIPDPAESSLYFLAIHADDADVDPDDPALKRIDTTWGEVYPEGSGSGYVDPAGGLPMTFTFSIDDEGRIDFVAENIDTTELAAAEQAPAEDPVQANTVRVDFAFDDDITMPSGVTDDRTDAFIEMRSRTFSPFGPSPTTTTG